METFPLLLTNSLVYKTRLLLCFGKKIFLINFTASLYILFLQPAASGSGVPAVIAYLNGVKMPHVVEFRVMVTRVLSTVATCVAGLAGGKVL